MPPSSTDPRRSTRVLIVLAGALALVGSCGIVRGVQGLDATAAPATSEISAGSGGVSEATAASAAKLDHALRQSPLRRPLAAANIVVSAMLVVGSFMLVQRRTDAAWWITQAVIANGLWTIAEVADKLHSLLTAREALRSALGHELQARLASRDAANVMSEQTAGTYMLWLYAALFVATGLVRLAFYAWAGVRTRRADVNALLAP